MEIPRLVKSPLSGGVYLIYDVHEMHPKYEKGVLVKKGEGNTNPVGYQLTWDYSQYPIWDGDIAEL